MTDSLGARRPAGLRAARGAGRLRRRRHAGALCGRRRGLLAARRGGGRGVLAGAGGRAGWRGRCARGALGSRSDAARHKSVHVDTLERRLTRLPSDATSVIFWRTFCTVIFGARNLKLGCQRSARSRAATAVDLGEATVKYLPAAGFFQSAI